MDNKFSISGLLFVLLLWGKIGHVGTCGDLPMWKILLIPFLAGFLVDVSVNMIRDLAEKFGFTGWLQFELEKIIMRGKARREAAKIKRELDLKFKEGKDAN